MSSPFLTLRASWRGDTKKSHFKDYEENYGACERQAVAEPARIILT
jgi:hypothetical protein